MNKEEKLAWIAVIDTTIREYKERNHSTHVTSCSFCRLSIKINNNGNYSYYANCDSCIQPKNPKKCDPFDCNTHFIEPQFISPNVKMPIPRSKIIRINKRIRYLKELKQRLIDSPEEMTITEFKNANIDLSRKEFSKNQSSVG